MYLNTEALVRGLLHIDRLKRTENANYIGILDEDGSTYEPTRAPYENRIAIVFRHADPQTGPLEYAGHYIQTSDIAANDHWFFATDGLDEPEDPHTLALTGETRTTQILADLNGLDYVALDQFEARLPIYVKWNNMPVYFPDQQPMIKNNRVLVPIRPLVERLGSYEIVVSGENAGTITLEPKAGAPEESTVVFTLGENHVEIKDAETGKVDTRPLDAPLSIANGRLMVPIRTLGEVSGDVEWNDSNHTVYIVAQ